MSPTPSPDADHNPDLRRFREYVSAAIAAVVIIGTIFLLSVAVIHANTSTADQFTHFKDLLLLVNPLVGVVIGYYFNKTSTEARAENAENTARSATTATQQTVQERNEARVQEQQVKMGLSNLTKAAEHYKTVTSTATPGVLGGGNQAQGNKQAFDDAYAQLDAALAHAKSLTA